MTPEEFRRLLRDDRKAALMSLLAAWVAEWLEDGPDEAVRVLSLWASRSVDGGEGLPILQLGTDDEIIEYAVSRNLVEDLPLR